MLQIKKDNILSLLAFFISVVLFFIPFFWLPSGYVDLGGDSGRLFFLDPLSIAQSLYLRQTPQYAPSYALLPYLIIIFLFKQVIESPTLLINIEQGMKLSLSFYFFYLIVVELLCNLDKNNKIRIQIISIAGAFAYLGFISRFGWLISLETHNQLFINLVIFYFLLKFLISKKIHYLFSVLLVSIIFSGSFGFSAMPQLLAFYPFCFLFLLVYTGWILKKKIEFKTLVFFFLLFLGLHSFHIVPTIASVFDKEGLVNARIFSQDAIQNAGLHYFDTNRQAWGKLSNVLFQPSNWNNNVVLLLIIPSIVVLGFIKSRFKLLVLTGFFFLTSLFLVSANITLLGVRLYRQLFYIPGFMMFRSFYEKWYYLFVFFYALLFAFALYNLFKRRNKVIVVAVSLIVSIAIIIRIIPFLQGSHNRTMIYDSKNIPVIFDVNPNFLTAANYFKSESTPENILVLPLTSAYFQVVQGINKGAYIGVPFISQLTTRRDFSGFWNFGLYEEDVLDGIINNDVKKLQQIFSLLNISYIFWNSDPRIIDSFKSFPYYEFKMERLKNTPLNQNYYKSLLQSFGSKNVYNSGPFRIEQMPKEITRPMLYVPDIIYNSLSDLFTGSSFRSGYLDDKLCQRFNMCNKQLSYGTLLNFDKVSPTEYKFQLQINTLEPFFLVLSEPYHKSWKVILPDSEAVDVSDHVVVNGSVNGWLIKQKYGTNQPRVIEGSIYLEFVRYYTIGRFISILTLVFIFLSIFYVLIQKHFRS